MVLKGSYEQAIITALRKYFTLGGCLWPWKINANEQIDQAKSREYFTLGWCCSPGRLLCMVGPWLSMACSLWEGGVSLEGTHWQVVLSLGGSEAYCGWLSQWPSLYKGKAGAQMSVQCLQADIGMEPFDWLG